MSVSEVVDVRVVQDVDGYVVEAFGDLDLAGVESMNRAVQAAHAARVRTDDPLVIDLAGVEFMDSEGLRALLMARELAGGSASSVVLRGPSDAVLVTLALAGLGDAFTVA